MYKFQTIDGQVFSTVFSPHEIAEMWCYDAYDEEGNSYVVLTTETNFRTFQYNQ